MRPLLLSLILLAISCASTKSEKVVIAHRGAPGYLPEHTLEGVSMAHAWQVDYIEPDLVVTKDDRLVVLHDIHIDTTTNVAQVFPRRNRKDGRFYAVDFTLRELKQLQVQERVDLATGKRVFPQRFPLKVAAFKIPTFEEFIELVQGLNQTTGRNIGIYPELKSPEFHHKQNKDIAKLAVAVLERYDLNRPDAKVIVQCFYPPTLKRLKNDFNLQVPLVFLIAENDWNESSVDYDYYKTDKGLKEVAQYADGIGPYLGQLIEYDEDNKPKPTKLVALAKKHNLKVHPYTHRLDQLPLGFEDHRALLDFLFNRMEVDGVFSDFADTVMIYLDK